MRRKINDICFDENEKIAVVLNRGALQIIAVMAVLYSGHTYVPIGTHHPEDRRNKIIDKADIKCIISETSLDIKFKNVILADRIDENDEELYRDINKNRCKFACIYYIHVRFNRNAKGCCDKP